MEKKHFRHSAKNSKLNMVMFTLLLFTWYDITVILYIIEWNNM